MGLEKHPVLVSVLVSKKLSGLGLGLGLEACGLDYNTDVNNKFDLSRFSFLKWLSYVCSSDVDLESDFLQFWSRSRTQARGFGLESRVDAVLVSFFQSWSREPAFFVI